MKSGSIYKWVQQRSVGLATGGAGVGFGGVGNGYSRAVCQNLLSELDCVRVWNPLDTVKHTHHGGIFNFDFTSDGSVLAAACEQSSILLFDPNNGKLIGARNNAHTDCVNCVRFLDSRMFATCSDDTTACLWDLRNMSQHVCVLRGHNNWVKNVDYISETGSLVTSGFDGIINVWDINRCTEGSSVSSLRALHVKGLMRCRVFPDGSKLVLSTSEGFLMVIHNLHFKTLARDMQGFKPHKYHQVQTGHSSAPGLEAFNKLFTAKRNRVELINDFPLQDNAGMITSLDIHPQNWCVASRNTSSGEMSEWTCVHDIQGTVSDVECGSFQPVARTRGAPQRFFRVLSSESFNADRAGPPESPPTDRHLPDDDDDSEDVDSDDSDYDLPVFIGDLLRWPPAAASRVTERSEQVMRIALPASISWNPVRRDSSRSNGRSPPRHDRSESPPVLGGLLPPPSSRPRDDDQRRSDEDLLRAGRVNLSRICRPSRRLTHYIDEPNVGRGYIKEIAFGAGGRVIASPFGFGIRLLAFDSDCSELCDCANETASRTPVQLREVVANVSHGSVVVTSRFSPGGSLLVTGSLAGKVCFHQPRW